MKALRFERFTDDCETKEWISPRLKKRRYLVIQVRDWAMLYGKPEMRFEVRLLEADFGWIQPDDIKFARDAFGYGAVEDLDDTTIVGMLLDVHCGVAGMEELFSRQGDQPLELMVEARKAASRYA